MFEIRSGRVNVGDIIANKFSAFFFKVLNLYPPTTRYPRGRARVQFLKHKEVEEINDDDVIGHVVVPDETDDTGKIKYATFKSTYHGECYLWILTHGFFYEHYDVNRKYEKLVHKLE